MDQDTTRAVMAESIPAGWAVPGVLFLWLSTSLVPCDSMVSYSSVCVNCSVPNSAWMNPVLCLFKTVGSERWPNHYSFICERYRCAMNLSGSWGPNPLSVKSQFPCDACKGPFLLSVKTSIFVIAFDSCTYPQCVTINCIIFHLYNFLILSGWGHLDAGEERQLSQHCLRQ